MVQAPHRRIDRLLEREAFEVLHHGKRVVPVAVLDDLAVVREEVVVQRDVLHRHQLRLSERQKRMHVIRNRHPHLLLDDVDGQFRCSVMQARGEVFLQTGHAAVLRPHAMHFDHSSKVVVCTAG
eukprot:417238-Rhodomonas_salina.1